MKKQKTLRIPRKLKKQYKKLWRLSPQHREQKAKDLIVVKKSIRFGIWGSSPDTKVWGCETRPR